MPHLIEWTTSTYEIDVNIISGFGVYNDFGCREHKISLLF